MGKDKPRHSVGQRRLADALCSPDQPSMRNTTTPIRVQQSRLGLAMTEQDGRLARMRDRNLRFHLTGAHAVLARLPAAVKNRSCKADQTLAATIFGSAVVSIKTHRCGSAAAIRRYASRNS